MKATDFDLSKDIQFSVETGVTTFRDSRIVVMDSNAVGLLRNNAIEELGWDKARRMFLRFGYQNGFSDFMAMKLNYEFDTEMDLLASGPVIHTWEGVVQATPSEIQYDRGTGEFAFTGVWRNSWEAEQHLMYQEAGSESICWSLQGYASGWCTGFFGKPLVAIEPVCMGKGDEHCGWDIRPPEQHGDQAKVHIEVFTEFWKAL